MTNILLNLAAIVLSGIAVHSHTGSMLDAVAAAAVVYTLMPWHPRAR